MLSYAYQNLHQKIYRKIETESFENVYDLFAAILAIGITLQLKQGLNREYIENKDVLSTLKGKIDLRESMYLKIRGDHRLACNYDDLSENHYMNQILKSTMLFLIYNGTIQRKNKDALKKALLFFSNVSPLEISSINWQRIQYNRGNSSYRILMHICYLLLHELLLTTEDGKLKLVDFLDDQLMSRLYEKFILGYYKRHFNQFHPAALKITWNSTGSIDYLPEMRSDVILFDNKSRKKLIIDAKCYGSIFQTQYFSESIRSGHLYQIYAYVKNEDKNNSGLVDGMLLYAKTDEHNFQNMSYNLGGNQIHVKTLDLGKEFSYIQNQLNSCVKEWLKTDT